MSDKEYSEYEEQADTFLLKHGILFTYKYVGNSYIGNLRCFQFLVTLSQTVNRENREWSFSFRSSHNDWMNGIKTITAYDVLANISGDQHYTNEDVIMSDLGYDDDGRIAEIMQHARSMIAFFTKEQLEDLNEIQ